MSRKKPKEIQPLPMTASTRRSLVRSLWILVRFWKRVFGTIYRWFCRHEERLDLRLGYPPGTIVEQLEHVLHPRGPWVVIRRGDCDYLLKHAENVKLYNKNGGCAELHQELYVYDRHLHPIPGKTVDDYPDFRTGHAEPPIGDCEVCKFFERRAR